MKKIIIMSMVGIALVMGACNNETTSTSKNESSDSAKVQMLDTIKLAKGAVFYQCPMHPEVISDKAGACPKCGMDLEKVEKK